MDEATAAAAAGAGLPILPQTAADPAAVPMEGLDYDEMWVAAACMNRARLPREAAYAAPTTCTEGTTSSIRLLRYRYPLRRDRYPHGRAFYV